MADRNVLTLPLRKRKHYMNEGEASSVVGGGVGGGSSSGANNSAAGGVNETVATIATAPNATTDVAANAAGAKVMRMSSVIQFAKAT